MKSVKIQKILKSVKILYDEKCELILNQIVNFKNFWDFEVKVLIYGKINFQKI